MTELKIKNGIMKSVFITFDCFLRTYSGVVGPSELSWIQLLAAVAGARLCKRRTALWQSRVAQYVLGHYDSGR